MRKLLISIHIVSLFFGLSAQEFATKIYFKDALGNKDTITVGYSLLATGSINKSLGEHNLSDIEIDTTFFAGISDVKSDVDINKYKKASYRSKTKFVNTNEPDYRRYLCIDVISHSYPFTISWDKNTFIDSARSKSFIICTNPGGWFDVGIDEPHWLLVGDSVNYSKSFLEGNEGSYYIDSIHSKPIKIWKFYIDFAKSDFNLSVNEIKSSLEFTYTNPCENTLEVRFSHANRRLVELFSVTGKLYYSKYLGNLNESIDISKISTGIFILKVVENDKLCVCKIIKK